MSSYKDFSVINQTKTEFKELFLSIATYKNRYAVFSDLIFFMAAAFKNSMVSINKNSFSESVENEYLKLIKSYNKNDQENFAKLFGLAVIIADNAKLPADNLGDFFMEMGFGESRAGQFFTPDEVSVLMAKLKLPLMDIKGMVNKQGYITISDPACGAGSTLLACVAHCIEIGLQPHRNVFIHGVDIDRTVALMCYVQLCLWHVPCAIQVGDSLTNKYREVWHSPAYHLGMWEKRLKLNKAGETSTKKKQGDVNFILIGETYT